MFSIGEFSKVTGLTIKTLRFYHEQGILEPSYVDSGSGYRYYADCKVETARVIAALRELEFSVAEISEIVGSCDDDSDILMFLESRKNEIQNRMKSDRRIVRQLDELIMHEREANVRMTTGEFGVEEKTVQPMLVATISMVGKYSDCGSGFAAIGRKMGRHICGKAMLLIHDTEYRSDDANFEAAMPVRKGQSVDKIEVRELPGGSCLSLMHHGPYDELGRSYEKLLRFAKENAFQFSQPTREIYHKGPGMIFRGNPKKYLTEIQLMRSENG